MHSFEQPIHDSYNDAQSAYMAGVLPIDQLFDQYPDDTADTVYDIQATTDSERQLMADIDRLQPKNQPRLSSAEEKQLFQAIAAGKRAQPRSGPTPNLRPTETSRLARIEYEGQAAKRIIFNSNLRFIADFAYSSTKKQMSSGAELGFGESFSIVAEAFYEAIEIFDPENTDGRIRGFASQRMRAALAKAIKDINQSPY